jgi:hypothetical protein
MKKPPHGYAAPSKSGELMIGATDLTFIDRRSLIVLGEFAVKRGGFAALRTANTIWTRVVELLDLADIRVEPTR